MSNLKSNLKAGLNRELYHEHLDELTQLVEDLMNDKTLPESVTYYFKDNKELCPITYLPKDKDNHYLDCIIIGKAGKDFYVADRALGRGAFKQVRLARNLKTGATCAQALLDCSPRNLAMAKNEILNLQFFQKNPHPGIIDALWLPTEPIVEGRAQAIYLEYCDEGTLSELTGDQNKFDKITRRDRIRLDEAIADVLAFIHSHGFVFKDLKLENVLVTLSDKRFPIRLIDFGLMCHKDSEQATVSNGTTKYLSPEIIKQKRVQETQFREDQDTQSRDGWAHAAISHRLYRDHLPFFCRGLDTISIQRLIRGLTDERIKREFDVSMENSEVRTPEKELILSRLKINGRRPAASTRRQLEAIKQEIDEHTYPSKWLW